MAGVGSGEVCFDLFDGSGHAAISYEKGLDWQAPARPIYICSVII